MTAAAVVATASALIARHLEGDQVVDEPAAGIRGRSTTVPEFTVTMIDTVQYVVTVTAENTAAAEAYAVAHCTEDDTEEFIGVTARHASAVEVDSLTQPPIRL